MSELIQFECPQCRKSLSAKPKHAGRSTKCPACESLVTVPSTEDETEDVIELEEAEEPTASPSQSNLGEANSRPVSREKAFTPPAPSFETPRPAIPGPGPQPVVYAMPQQASWPTHPFTFPPPTPSLPVPPQYQAIPPNYTTEGLHGDATATKTCPACAEVIKAEAAKCRFCGHEFKGGTNRINQKMVVAIATALPVVTMAVVLAFQWPAGDRLREQGVNASVAAPATDPDQRLKDGFERAIRSNLKDPESLRWTGGAPSVLRFIWNQDNADFFSGSDDLDVGEKGIIVMGTYTATNSYGGRVSATYVMMCKADGTVVQAPFDWMNETKRLAGIGDGNLDGWIFSSKRMRRLLDSDEWK